MFEFGGGGDRILLDDIQCDGNEANVLQCIHNGIDIHDCVQYEHAGVSCSNDPPILYACSSGLHVANAVILFH